MLSPINIAKMLQYWGTPFVTIMYRCFLNREPDSDGLKYYLGRLEQGYDRLTIIEQILKSSETKIHYSTQDLVFLRLEIKKLSAQQVSGFLPIARIFSQSFTKSQRIMLNRLNELQYQIEKPQIPFKTEFYAKQINLPSIKSTKSINSNLSGLSPLEKKAFKNIYNQF